MTKKTPNTKKDFQTKTLGQQTYLDIIKNNDIVLCHGPSGSGKTFCAIAYAVNQLLQKNISKIILAKPLLEAEKEIGSLPGDLKDKTQYYYGSLVDTIKEFLGYDQFQKFISNKKIEFLPISFWRGHTFSNSIVIVDEAQNLLMSQFKLAITRIGFGSKIIFCGDNDQSDLRHSKPIYKDVIDKLTDIDRLSSVKLTTSDIVRNDIIAKVLKKLQHS